MCSNRCEMPVMPGRSLAEPTWATQPPATVGERWRGMSSSFIPLERKCSSTAMPAARGGAAADLAAALGAARPARGATMMASAAQANRSTRLARRWGVDMSVLLWWTVNGRVSVGADRATMRLDARPPGQVVRRRVVRRRAAPPGPGGGRGRHDGRSPPPAAGGRWGGGARPTRLQALYGDRGDVVIVGVHTPELDREKDPKAVARAVRQNQLPYPVLIDGEWSNWNAFHNQYWPALYLIDRRGVIRKLHIGELHEGTPGWSETVSLVDSLR